MQRFPVSWFSEETQSLLARLLSERQRTKTPNVSDSTGGFLFDLVRSQWYRHILELGTANGYSAIYLLEAIRSQSAEKRPAGHLLTIESKRDDYLRAKSNLAGYRDQVTLVCADAGEFLRSAAGDLQFDFIFIDALKSATLEHFLLSRKLLRPNGTIVVDDVVKYSDKMRDFYEYLQKNDIAYEIVMTDPDDGVMVIQ